MSNLHIFLGLENIAGYSSMLKKGFDQLGVACDLYTRGTHRFKYHSGNRNVIANLFTHILGSYNKLYQNKNLVLKTCGYVIDAVFNSFLLVYAVIKYDVFIFTYKNCFYQHLGFIDLPILKLFKKKIIFIFHGSDTRPPYINGAFLAKKNIRISQSNTGSVSNLNLLQKRSRKQKNDILKIEKHADYLVSGPATSHFHQRKFVSYFHIGIPYEIKINRPKKDVSHNRPTKILHSPSHPEAKGTDTIRQAIYSLRQKGYQIDFIEIVDQPNRVVLEKLAECDFVVDQMYSPNPMPGFVTEAAAFGKPAVICGYFFDQIHDALPLEKIPPSLYRHPDDIENSIERLIVDKEFRIELGQKAQVFVKSYWQSKKVAERFMKIVNNDLPDSWYYNPSDIKDVHGACISEEKLKEVVKSLIEAYGKEALCLSDKPSLEKLFIEFAYA